MRVFYLQVEILIEPLYGTRRVQFGHEASERFKEGEGRQGNTTGLRPAPGGWLQDRS